MSSEFQSFPRAQRHGPIEQILTDIFVVYGSMRMAPLMRIGRNMVICRDGDRLTLLNPIRLSAAGEAELEKLGRVTDVVRLGFFHGLDDAYCVHRFGARFWCQPGSNHYAEPSPDAVLNEEAALPIRAARVITFRATRAPEAVVCIERDGGLLVTCDSLQHYAGPSRATLVARLVMRWFGYTQATQVSPLWLKYMRSAGGDLQADFDRILECEFERLISAHGALLDRQAHAAAAQAVGRALGG